MLFICDFLLNAPMKFLCYCPRHGKWYRYESIPDRRKKIQKKHNSGHIACGHISDFRIVHQHRRGAKHKRYKWNLRRTCDNSGHADRWKSGVHNQQPGRHISIKRSHTEASVPHERKNNTQPLQGPNLRDKKIALGWFFLFSFYRPRPFRKLKPQIMPAAVVVLFTFGFESLFLLLSTVGFHFSKVAALRSL